MPAPHTQAQNHLVCSRSHMHTHARGFSVAHTKSKLTACSRARESRQLHQQRRAYASDGYRSRASAKYLFALAIVVVVNRLPYPLQIEPLSAAHMCELCIIHAPQSPIYYQLVLSSSSWLARTLRSNFKSEKITVFYSLYTQNTPNSTHVSALGLLVRGCDACAWCSSSSSSSPLTSSS